MSVLVSFAAAVTMGMPSEPPQNGPYNWSLTYHDGVVVQLGETTIPQITFTPRASHRFFLQVCNLAGCTMSENEVCVEPIPGDSQCDGAVGINDYLDVGFHFGEVIP